MSVTVEFTDDGEVLSVKTENSRWKIEDGTAFVTSTIEGDLDLLPVREVDAVLALPLVDSVKTDSFYERNDL